MINYISNYEDFKKISKKLKSRKKKLFSAMELNTLL
tara:strand:+ start:22 stop:129 length:108 start_codon:yes stop_codon:yes gene_type:complete